MDLIARVVWCGLAPLLTAALLDCRHESAVPPTALVEPSDRGPAATFSILEQRLGAGLPPSPADLLALAGLADMIGQRQTLLKPAEAIRWSRDAAVYAAFCLAESGRSETPDATRSAARDVHNRALARCLRLAGNRALAGKSGRTASLAQAGLILSSPVPEWTALGFDRLEPAADQPVIRLDRVRREGLGVPLVAGRRLEGDAATAWKPYGPREASFAATAVIRPKGPAARWREHPVECVLHDPLREDTLTFGGSAFPLAHDLTAPLVRRLHQTPIRNYEYLGVVDSAFYQERAGAYAIDPYQLGKIPVVLIQGLWTGPAVWLPMINAFRSDPALRARYQFWIVLYPSGYSLPVAARSLRESLREIRRTFDPRQADPALDQMVILGKSTGGQAARMLVQASGVDLWNAVFTRPPEQVRASPALGAELAATLFYEPEPTVKRVIFVTTGHRGSKRARQPAVRLGARLIRWNSPAHTQWAELIAANGRDVLQPYVQDHPLSSIDGMKVGSPLLQAIDRGPIAPGTAYHSIIANLPLAALLDGQGTDGLVTYQSARLDGAVSERIIPGSHFCEADPALIAEVRRILLESP